MIVFSQVHSPLQCPEEFTQQYPLDDGGVCQSTPETCGGRGYGPSCGCAHMCYCNRRIIRGMISVVDAMLANLTVSASYPFDVCGTPVCLGSPLCHPSW